jgi:nitrite reductase/ring-hydroxylating ferredoxin subunit
MSNRLPKGTELTRLDQLPDGASRGFVFGGAGADRRPQRILLVRVGDEVHAYVNCCPHAGRLLNLLPDRFLTRDGGLIQCCQHGALFEKVTGECIAGPCAGEYLTRVPTVVIDGVVRSATDFDLAAS